MTFSPTTAITFVTTTITINDHQHYSTIITSSSPPSISPSLPLHAHTKKNKASVIIILVNIHTLIHI